MTDPIADGHHPTFLRLIAGAFADHAGEVVVLGPMTAAPEPGTRHRTWELTGVSFQGRLAERRQGIYWLRMLAAHLDHIESQKRQEVSLVFLSYFDLFLNRYLLPLDWRRIVGSRRFSGLVFRAESTSREWLRGLRRGPLAPWALLRSSLCPAVGTLNEHAAAVLSDSLSDKPVLLFPDFAPEPCTNSAPLPLLQEISSRAGHRALLVLVGALDGRKGLQEFFRLAELLPQESWFLVCAGRIYSHTLSSETSQLLAESRSGRFNNILVCDRWLTDAEFDAILQAATAVFAAYRGFSGSSNLLTKAAQAAKPVLVSEGGLMAERVQRYQTGHVVLEGDVLTMANLLSSEEFKYFRSSPEFLNSCKRYAADHSLTRLSEIVGSLCRIHDQVTSS